MPFPLFQTSYSFQVRLTTWVLLKQCKCAPEEEAIYSTENNNFQFSPVFPTISFISPDAQGVEHKIMKFQRLIREFIFVSGNLRLLNTIEQQNSSASVGGISFLQLSDSFRIRTNKLCDPEWAWVSAFMKWGQLIRWSVGSLLNLTIYRCYSPHCE